MRKDLPDRLQSSYRLHPDATATKQANGSLLIEHEDFRGSLSIVPTDPESEPPTIEIAESKKDHEYGQSFKSWLASSLSSSRRP